MEPTVVYRENAAAVGIASLSEQSRALDVHARSAEGSSAQNTTHVNVNTRFGQYRVCAWHFVSCGAAVQSSTIAVDLRAW